MSEFSLSLNEDQQQIQKWVHDFAETVVRPAAEEWDEREEFPRPIVEEAAKIGLARRPERPHPAGRPRGAVLG
jgi:acyl-CoA dehydrogenase